MLLGGRAAENVIFGKITTGAEDDLKKILKILKIYISFLQVFF